MKSLSSILPYWYLEGSVMVFKDGSFGRCIKLEGFDLTCKMNSELNTLSLNLQNFILGLNENYTYQIYYHVDEYYDSMIKKHKEVCTDDNNLINLVKKERVDHLSHRAKNSEFFTPKISVFLRSAPKNYNTKEGTDSEDVREDFLRRKKAFLSDSLDILELLNSAGLKGKFSTEKEFFRSIFEVLNPDYPRDQEARIDETYPLSYSLALTDLEENEKRIKIGEYFYQAISLKLPPENETFITMISRMLTLPFHFRLIQNIRVPEQKKEKAQLEIKRRLAHSMASSAKNVSDIESEGKLNQIEELLEEMIQGSTKLVEFDFNILIRDKNKESLKEKSKTVLKFLREMDRSEGVIESYTTMDQFVKMLPGSCKLFRPLKLKSSNCAHLLPVFSSWQGNDRAVCLLETKDSVPFSLDPFEKTLPNWNGVVIGSSGAGKSFTVASLMMQFCCQNPRPKLIWVDNGASSQRLVESLGGSFLDFSLKSNLRINLFDLPKGEKKPSAQKVKLILAILEMMLKEDGHKSLPKKERALLEEAIYNVYGRMDDLPTLSDLRADLEKHKVERLREYASILYSWTGATAYGKILDGKSNISLEKDLISFEVQHLSDYPDLKNVVLLLITSFIQDKAQEDLSTPYLLLIDEAERLFQTELACQFVITCYRTWRKFNAAIWCMSQNYRDFLSNAQIADSLLPNTTNLIILRQRKIDWEDFKNAFDFNEAQVENIKSLEIKKGQYSEFFFLQDENQAILRLVPTPLTYWLCTTDAMDKEKINLKTQENPKMEKLEILYDLSKEAA